MTRQQAFFGWILAIITTGRTWVTSRLTRSGRRARPGRLGLEPGDPRVD